ncbi:putative amidase [Aaosphaeria arxii CBS 175.79]|uniref:amidase n=1 Tax=Aaosphaeria arxii CBS 175.79 TaxID=1450172 RepID=A0A6A5X7N1_9PLEO|nr:putative amidase [Aaosphaeria arxii CBS 175.79]KAF2009035.1 putative amidase [Aaosphaeria arxii CBS 175.79]
MNWKTKVTEKQEQREAAIKAWGLSIPNDLVANKRNVKYLPNTSGILSRKELDITESSATIIVDKIRKLEWSAEEVLRAFVSRAVLAHQLTNPLTEVFFERGLYRARELDKIFKDTGKPVGPLHGLPISLKDTLHIKGLETTQGYAGWIGNVQNEDDSLVKILINAGAVLYCKTNVPQTLMSGECVNFVFGRTSSPWNTSLSAGGSSGGEGSLISLGGSPLGIGSDIAGSIRTPANFNGIYGLCPSTCRFPGHRANKLGGESFIKPVFGPLSRSVDGLEVYTRAILSARPWEVDHQVLRLPWNEVDYQEGLGRHHTLTFGFMRHDHVVLPDPPILRCIEEVRDKLQKSGHHVIDIAPFEGVELMSAMEKIFGATGAKDVREILAKSGEPLIKEVEFTTEDTALSTWEYKRAGVQLSILRQKYLEIVNNTSTETISGRPIDGIILPSGGHVAPPHGTMEYYTYEAISNALDWTCATFPVGFVNSDLDTKPKSFHPMSKYDERNHAKYSPEAYADAPVCLQLMGVQHSEEKVLGLLRTVEAALGRGPNYMA